MNPQPYDLIHDELDHGTKVSCSLLIVYLFRINALNENAHKLNENAYNLNENEYNLNAYKLGIV